MAINEELSAFLKEGLERGLPREELEGVLLETGWPPDEVRGALVTPGRIRGLENTPPGTSCLVLEGTDVRPEVSRRKISAIRQILREMG